MANAYSLDLEFSSSQCAYIADDADLDFSTTFTLEAWHKAESLSADRILVAKYNAGGNQRAYRWEILTDGKLQLIVSDDGTSSAGHFETWQTDASAVTTGTYVHLAVTYTITTEAAIFYVNGSAVATSQTGGTTVGASLFNSTAPFMIGASETVASPANFGDGLYNNVRAWNVVRTPGEIAANYRKVLTSGTGLVGAWYASANNHEDLTSNNNDLTAVGTPTFSTDIPFTDGSGPLFFAQY